MALSDDDPDARLSAIGRPVNGFIVGALGTDLYTVKSTLNPRAQPRNDMERT